MSDINFERLENALVYIQNNLMDSDDDKYLTVDSLIDINNIITSSNNITPRNVNVKPCGFDKMYMDKDLIEGKLYQLVDQFSGKQLITEISILHHLKIYIHFKMEMEGLVRYYLLAVSFYSLNLTIKLDYCGQSTPSQSRRNYFRSSFEKVGTIFDIFGLGLLEQFG